VWQWHQLDHMQVCTSLQTDNHASTPPLRLDALPATQPTASKLRRDTLTNAMNYIIVIGINVKSAWNSARMISAQSADSLSPRVTIEYCCYHNAETDFIMFVYILKNMIYTYKPLESPGLSV